MRRLVPALLLALVATLLAVPASAHDGSFGLTSAQQIPDEITTNVPCENGFALDFPCENIDLLAFIPKEEFGIELSAIAGMSEAWGWFDEETGDEYAIVGVSNGVHFVRITDPFNPVYLGLVPNTAAAQLVWYDMKTNDDVLVFGSESAPHNVRTFDLTELRGVESMTIFADLGRYPLNVSSHNVIVNDETDRGYLVGGNIGIVVPDQCSGGLVALDLTNPVLPTELGCYDEDGYIHDAQCIVYDGPDTEHTGKEICLGSNEDTFSTIDVTDASAMTRLGLLEYPQTAYTHQGWISEDHTTFFLGDELDEQDFGINTRTLIIDIEDLDNPRLISEYVHETTSIDHNMYVRDGLLYQSNYTSGLRVFDTSRARSDATLDPVGFFDTFPDNDDAVFAGTWGNYPFLPSGNIVISSGDEGLFVVRMADTVSASAEATTTAQPAPADTSSPEAAPAATPDAAPTSTPTTAAAPTSTGASMPATGGGLALAALALAGAAATRRRRG